MPNAGASTKANPPQRYFHIPQMNPDFWLERWREGHTHFHQSRITPLLQKYWPRLARDAGSQVLVPLCGKTLAMIWLAEQGPRGLGVELSSLAAEQFLSDTKLHPAITVRHSTPPPP